MISTTELARLTTPSKLAAFMAAGFQGDPEKLVNGISQALNQLLTTDLKQAERMVGVARRVFELLPSNYRPRFLTLQARLAHWSGKSRTARRLYERALDQLQRQRDFGTAAQTRQGLMDVYMYLGQYEPAIETGKKALAYFRRKGKLAAAGRIFTNLGNVYHRLDRNERALAYYEQARRIFEKDGGVPLAIVDFNRANIYANLNQLRTAEQLYRESAAVFRKHGQALSAAKAEYSLAYLYFLTDQYTAALNAFDKVLEEFLRLGDLRAAAVTRLDLAEIDIYLNQPGSAAMAAQQGVKDFARLGQPYEQGKAAYFAAEALRTLGDYRAARAWLDLSEKLLAREHNQLWLGLIATARIQLDLESGRAGAGRELGGQALRLLARSGDYRRRVEAEIALAQTEFASKRAARAAQRLRKVQSERLTGHQLHQVHATLGKYYVTQSDYPAALKHFRQAIGATEKTLAGLYPDERRTFFATGRYSTYLAAVECLLHLGRVKDSFLENSEALAALNRRRSPAGPSQFEVPAQYLRTRESLRAALKRLSRTPSEGQRLAAAGESIPVLEHRLWATERRIRAAALQAKPEALERSAQLRNWLERLQPGEVLVNPVMTEASVGTFVVASGRMGFVPGRAGPNELLAALRRLDFLMEHAVYSGGHEDDSAAAIEAYLCRLQDWLLGGLSLPASTRRLILLVDGSLAQIPYPALLDGAGVRLKDKFELRLIVSPEDLAAPRAAAEFSEGESCAVFANAAAALPMIAGEAEKVQLAFPHARAYIGSQATCGNLNSELAAAEGFVHVAAHASRSSENPLFSRILMNDGPYFPFDLFAHGTRAELVTLSGCQTAAPGIYHGNSFSLAKAFYLAGARHVLASLWPVSDKVSMLFMAEFYENLKNTTDLFAAYRAALNKAESVNANPAFWSPFVLLGI